MKLFSIKEPYSSRIFDKEKLVELRRQNINIKEDEYCLVYTSSPVKKITGYFIVKEKIRKPIEALWKATKKFAGISKKAFFDYFKGCSEGTAIVFKKVKKFVRSADLSEIRSQIENFRPPQSFYNLDPSILLKLKGLLDDSFFDNTIPKQRILQEV